jgi:hypothetical protein
MSNIVLNELLDTAVERAELAERERDELRRENNELADVATWHQEQFVMMRQQRDELAAALESLPCDCSSDYSCPCVERWRTSGNGVGACENCFRLNTASLTKVCGKCSADPSAILREHDERRDAEVVALSAGLRLAHEQMLLADMPSDEIERTMGLDACKRVLELHDAALVKPLVEALSDLVESVKGLKPGEPVPFAKGMFEMVPRLIAADAALAPYREEVTDAPKA